VAYLLRRVPCRGSAFLFSETGNVSFLRIFGIFNFWICASSFSLYDAAPARERAFCYFFPYLHATFFLLEDCRLEATINLFMEGIIVYPTSGPTIRILFLSLDALCPNGEFHNVRFWSFSKMMLRNPSYSDTFKYTKRFFFVRFHAQFLDFFLSRVSPSSQPYKIRFHLPLPLTDFLQKICVTSVSHSRKCRKQQVSPQQSQRREPTSPIYLF